MIAPMKYVSVLLMKEDRECVLRAIRKSGVMMLCETEESTTLGAESLSKLRRMEKLIKGLDKYEKKTFAGGEQKSYSEEILDGELSEQEILANELEMLLAEKESLALEKEKTTQLADSLKPWLALDAPLESIGESVYTDSFVGTLSLKVLEACELAAKQNGAAIEEVSRDGATAYVVVTTMKDAGTQFLAEFGFEKVVLPTLSGTASQNFSRLENELLQMSERADKIEAELCEKANTVDAHKLLYEKASAQSEIEAAPFCQTEQTVLIEGWTEADKLEVVDKAISKTGKAYAIYSRDPEEGEEVPTLLKNKKITRQFEGITNMFNPPKYGEYDPNAVMAPWYWIIFGLMMGDAGYGILMFVLVLAIKLVMKPKGGMAEIMNVILYSSLPTIIFGFIFGSFFGETVKVPGLFWFSPLENPVMMLVFTLVVGVLHIYTGMIVKIYLDVKAGKLLDALFDQVSWMLVITGLGMLFLPMVSEKLAICSTIGTYMAIFGAIVILFTAGREKKGIFGKITGGLGGLYGITSYVSDILSYSRILALSLATGVVGMVMNLLAGMVTSAIPVPVVKYIPALLIYAVGHVFNLALGLLSAYVHDCRLQYIEFYGKFYDGGGKLFKPFKVETKYIELKK